MSIQKHKNHIQLLNNTLLINHCILVIFLILFSGCRKFESVEQDNNQSIENLVIPADFSWNTNNLVHFIITAEKSQVIKITSLDSQTLFHKSFDNTFDETYEVNVNIPTYVTEVLVNNTLVSITNSPVVAVLDQPNLKNTVQSTKVNEPLGSIALWHFDENDGNVVNDAQGNNNGLINGADWVTGINGAALNFNGENGLVKIPYNQSLDNITNKLSISLWFKLDHIQDDGTFIFQRVKYILRIDKWGKLSFSIYNPNWSELSTEWKDRIIDTDWHNVVATYNGSVMKIYLDNQLLGSKETSGNLSSSNSDLYIGNQATINYFDGSIDEINVFEEALSVAEINQIYTNTQNPDDGSQNLISKWELNEGGGAIASEPISGNTGSISGAEWVPGVKGSCLSFNGINSNVYIPKHSSLDFTNKLTIMAWAKTHDYKEAKIAQKGDWDGHGIGGTKWTGWKGHIRLNTENTVSIESTSGRPILDEWYHIAITYDGSFLKLYINGQLNNSQNVTGQLKINTRNASIGSDNGTQKFFNGLIDEVKFFSTALSQTEIQAIFNDQTVANDADGDGIPDDEDDYPEDPGRAFNNYYPASQYGSLAFEDLWPGKGDYDFNDLILDYRFTLVTNASNKISDIKADFVIKAIGAGYSNGFGFQLPNSNIQNNHLNISGYKLLENYIVLNENGTESGQDKVTAIVFDNAKGILYSNSGFGVNVTPDAPYISPDTTQINLTFNTDTYTAEDIDIQNFNPFLIIDGERGKEIHLPDMLPTNLASSNYFGTSHDDSNPASNRYYKTVNNLPWGINIPESYHYTIEKSQIISGYLKFAEWAESGGTINTDWYKDNSGYRNSKFIYQLPE